MGHKGYWRDEYTNWEDLCLDLISTYDLKHVEILILQLEDRMVLPIQLTIGILISSKESLYWAVPYLGLKKDAITGHIKKTTISSK